MAKHDPLGASDDPVAVIGLGRFGAALALELEKEGIEVLGIDSSAKLVQDLAGRLTHVVQADSTDETALRQLGVDRMSCAVVGIGSHIEASVLTTSALMAMRIPQVWAKAISEPHARILHQLGVHHVVQPERETGLRVAHLVRGQVLDYIEFDDGYIIVKMLPPKSVQGQSLGDAKVRTRWGVTIIGTKSPGHDFTNATPETIVGPDDTIIVSGDRRRLERFAAQA